MKALTILLFVTLTVFSNRPADAATCRRVADAPFIQINPEALRPFRRAELSRAAVFTLLQSVAQVETSGCWAGVSDNFDGQLVSAGVLQWNYGQNSLQALLINFKRSLGNQFPRFLSEKMPLYGSVIFSSRCLGNKVKDTPHPCEVDFLDPSDTNGKKLKQGFKSEFENLFEEDAMIQIQMDRVMALMDKTLDFSKRLFGEAFVSQKNFHWMFDIIVQQGGFSDLEAFKKDFERAWNYARSQDQAHQKMTAKGILWWYAGHAASPDQGGLDCDWRYNIEKWGQFVNAGNMDEEKFRLFMMSWMRARTASGENGRWQALAFQRRAKLSLGVGSVANSSVHRDNRYECKRPQPGDLVKMVNAIGP